MRTLTSPVSTEAAASQTGWVELYDLYLKSAIVTPLGTLSTLRLCTKPGGVSFFAPTALPEPAGTQGDPAEYS